MGMWNLCRIGLIQLYPADWGSKAHGIMEFDDLDTSAME